MATFAAQLKDMFFGLVERVTGYGCAEDKDAAGAQVPTKLASAEVSRTEEVIVLHNEIRSRSGDPFVSGGSNPKVNVNGI